MPAQDMKNELKTDNPQKMVPIRPKCNNIENIFVQFGLKMANTITLSPQEYSKFYR